MTDLCQFFTPQWVAECLMAQFFPKLDIADTVLEPTCGTGSWLKAVPPAVRAVGVEIDPAIVAIARAETGREIIEGDFRTVPLNIKPTVVVGNPPFRAEVFDGILDRCYNLLPRDGRAGFILPNYFFQTSTRVLSYNQRWSIEQQMLPRHAFHTRMRTPLIFALFSKEEKRLLVGFALYREGKDVMSLAKAYRDAFMQTTGSIWRAVTVLALSRLGGKASLPEIYREVEGYRPTLTQFWREKIRQVLRVHAGDFVPLGGGRYELVGA